MINRYQCHHPEELPELAGKILTDSDGQVIFAVQGPMGSGKTTLIKALCTALGVQEQVNSPTFSIVNEYFTRAGGRICHFDLYRIVSGSELRDIGFEDYIYSGDHCFIEWPEIALALLPAPFAHLKIEAGENENSRTFILELLKQNP